MYKSVVYVVLVFVKCLAQEFREDSNDYSAFDFPEPRFDRNERRPPHDVPLPPHPSPPIKHAGLPQNMSVTALPLPDSDHELMLNVSWGPNIGNPALEYSIKIKSDTLTMDCNSPMCYEYNIPGNASWWVIPQQSSPMEGVCEVKPGCAYRVSLIPHPWDGHTSANNIIELNECESGVCSCAHASFLPLPVVSTKTFSNERGMFANISWTLSQPLNHLRLAPGLMKAAYIVSIGKQMVSDAHPAPWYAHTTVHRIETTGSVFSGDSPKWVVLPLIEKHDDSGLKDMLDVRLLARVSLVDDRECVGPAGNATVYDPVEVRRSRSFIKYGIWAAIGGLCVLALLSIVAIGAGGVKRLLRALRPASSPAPLHPLRQHPTWLPLLLQS